MKAEDKLSEWAGDMTSNDPQDGYASKGIDGMTQLNWVNQSFLHRIYS